MRAAAPDCVLSAETECREASSPENRPSPHTRCVYVRHRLAPFPSPVADSSSLLPAPSDISAASRWPAFPTARLHVHADGLYPCADLPSNTHRHQSTSPVRGSDNRHAHPRRHTHTADTLVSSALLALGCLLACFQM